MADNREIGARIRSRRRELDITQRDLADALEVSISVVSQWERGLRPVPERRLQRLAELLQTSVRWLRTGVRDDE